MCGLAGIVDYDGRDSTALLQRMLQEILHRGPDGSGKYTDSEIALGHNRLAILDLTDRGDQPMHVEPLVLIHNGEIYNYQEIKQELISKHSVEFQSNSDTEVILQSYKAWGVKCFERFRGMWALALYDRRRKHLLVSRDRFGIKPLYYLQTEAGFYFASEIRALLTVVGTPRPDLQSVSDYLMLGFTDHAERTFFTGVKQLLPGHHLELDVSNRRLRTYPYYKLEENISSGPATREQFSQVLEDSIRLHLRSDVPVGTCLSGGLDSSTIASIAATHYQSQPAFSAITAGSEDPRKDEQRFAKQIVDRHQLDWHLIKPQASDFESDLPQVVKTQEQPSGSPSVLMQYHVMRLAQERGMKVLLDGQGGDEILLGYERYYSAVIREWLRQGKWLRALREFRLGAKNSRLGLLGMAQYYGYFSSTRIRKHRLNKLAPPLPEDLQRGSWKTLRQASLAGRSVHELQVQEIQKYQLPHLLRYEDRNSMAFSVEARVPLLDHRLVEIALALPNEEKIRNGFTKFALRQASNAYVPAGIAWRKEKIGFEAPTTQWMSQAEDWIETKLSQSNLIRTLGIPSTYWKQARAKIRYRLIELALWEEVFSVAA